MAGPLNNRQAQITIVFSGVTVPTGAVCTLGIDSVDKPIDAEDVHKIALALKPLHQTIASSPCTLSHIEAKIGPKETGPTISEVIGQSGSAGNNPQNPAACLLVRKELANVSGRYAGRMFWPGIDDNNVTASGGISQAHIEMINTQLNNFVDALADADVVPVVFGKPIAGGDGVHPIMAFRAQPILATQRRRLRR